MFRQATINELESLVTSQHQLAGGYAPYLPPSAPSPTESDEERLTSYKKELGNIVRETLVVKGSEALHKLLRVGDESLANILAEATGMKFDACHGCRTCQQCQKITRTFSHGVFSVLERDFVQLIHGHKGSDLLRDRPGVQFLLAGITLGLLYKSILETTGVDRIVAKVLAQMIDMQVWTMALELASPAPARQYGDEAIARDTRTASGSMSAMSIRSRQIEVNRSFRRRPSSQSYMAILLDPMVCSQCKTPFEDRQTFQKCDCGTVTIRYPELKWQSSENDAKSDSRNIQQAKSHRRAHSI